MTAETKAGAQRLYDAINEFMASGNAAVLDDALVVDAVDHNPDPDMTPGREGIKDAFAMLRAAFPDYRFTVEDIVCEGDKAACRITTRGTHRGAFMGVAATQRSVVLHGIDVLRVADGKVAERWGAIDTGAFFQQLGAIGPQKHVRHGVGSVRPYVHGLPSLLKMVTEALGGNVVEKIEDAKGAHVEVRLGDSMLVLELGTFEGMEVTKSSIYVYVEDVDRAYRRALELGATSLAAPEQKPYHERQAGVKDGFGNTWWIASFTGAPQG
jgi:PhnB protein